MAPQKRRAANLPRWPLETSAGRLRRADLQCMNASEMAAAGSLSIDTVLEALAGKSVAVVGNAESLLQTNHGEAIESADLVLRMNRALPPRPESHGRRTDILTFSVIAQVEKVIDQFNARWRVWMSPKYRDDEPPPGVIFYPVRFAEQLGERLGSRPSTGMLTLDMISRASGAKAFLYGFDFKATKSFYLTKDHLGTHDFAREADFTRALCAERGWQLA